MLFVFVFFQLARSFGATATDGPLDSPGDLPTGEAAYSPYGRGLGGGRAGAADDDDDELCIARGGSTAPAASAGLGAAVLSSSPGSSPGSRPSSSRGRHRGGGGHEARAAARALDGALPSAAALGSKLERVFVFQARKKNTHKTYTHLAT